MKIVHLTALGIVFALFGCNAPDEQVVEGDSDSAEAEDEISSTSAGKFLFERETFNGNGRTCRSCHGRSSGTVSIQDVNYNPPPGLFRSIDSDDGVGNNFSLLKRDATFRVTIPLPNGWRLADNLSANSVTFRRGASSTLNVPALDTIFMADGRNDTVQSQALGAVNGHYQPGRQPSSFELNAIAAFEKTDEFFSSSALRSFARGGPPPALPQGTTDAQKRGRVFFVDGPAGLCAACHSGPMLNETNSAFPGVNPGERYATILVSEFNRIGQPVHPYTFTPPGGTPQNLPPSPDPGRALITGDPADYNQFRIPTLWGVKKTAPYFHDNSAKTLVDVVAHYSDFFNAAGFGPLTTQQQNDIVEYMLLL